VGEDEAVIALLTDILGKPILGEPSLLEGAYPAAVSLAVELFRQDTGLTETALEIISVAETEWPDGCLGLAEADEACTLAIVPGLQIIIRGQDNEYEIRTNTAGTFMRWQLRTGSAP
jgi:hypothetical protein